MSQGPLNLIHTNQFKWAPQNNIDPGGPGLLNLIFANQFEWAPNNNSDPGGPNPFNLMFVNQFKRIRNPSEVKGFYPKVANRGPHLIFL